MEIDAKITMLFDDNGLTISIVDRDSLLNFINIRLSAQQTVQAFSRLSNVSVEKCEVVELDKVGKKMEHKIFEFKITGKALTYQAEEIKELALKECPEGWIPDLYFKSQNSFFNRDGKPYARCTIRKWIDKE